MSGLFGVIGVHSLVFTVTVLTYGSCFSRNTLYHPMEADSTRDVCGAHIELLLCLWRESISGGVSNARRGPYRKFDVFLRESPTIVGVFWLVLFFAREEPSGLG